MASEWLSGAFTALGAVLGAGATLGSGLIGNRAQRGLAQASRQAQIADVRREAYAGYLTAVYGFMDSARELIAVLEAAAGTADCDAAHGAYLDHWVNLQPKYAPVLVAGPTPIEASAEKLRYCLGDLADHCDGWYSARKNGHRFRDEEKVVSAQLAAREARSEFASAARDNVYG